jgi:hypothetical protein
MHRRVVRVALAVFVGFCLLQLVPYGWWHENPPVVRDAPWPDAEVAAIARGACYDCHSNETEWPPYSWVAPMSWLVRNDVESGRRELDFSDWDEHADDAHHAAEAIQDGVMPPPQYRLMHPDARLSDEEAARLVAALEAMDTGGGGGGDNSGHGNAEDGG